MARLAALSTALFVGLLAAAGHANDHGARALQRNRAYDETTRQQRSQMPEALGADENELDQMRKAARRGVEALTDMTRDHAELNKKRKKHKKRKKKNKKRKKKLRKHKKLQKLKARQRARK
jgi:hypothetical protein